MRVRWIDASHKLGAACGHYDRVTANTTSRGRHGPDQHFNADDSRARRICQAFGCRMRLAGNHLLAILHADRADAALYHRVWRLGDTKGYVAAADDPRPVTGGRNSLLFCCAENTAHGRGHIYFLHAADDPDIAVRAVAWGTAAESGGWAQFLRVLSVR